MSAANVPDAVRFDALLVELARSGTALPDKPEETPEAALRALWFTAAGVPRAATRAAGALPSLDAQGEEALRRLVDRRLAGEPLAYLTGRQEFLGLELHARPGALIPRRETELLAGVALDATREAAGRRGSALVIDVCTGSGNVALAIAAHEPRARVHASDLSEEAVALARENAILLGLAERVTFESGDLFAPQAAAGLRDVDVISCNPPYISSAKVPLMAAEIARHEPSLAFDGGTFGLDVLLRVIREAPQFLRPGGLLCFEVGLGQAHAIAGRVRRNDAYAEVWTVPDANGHDRVVSCRVRG